MDKNEYGCGDNEEADEFKLLADKIRSICNDLDCDTADFTKAKEDGIMKESDEYLRIYKRSAFGKTEFASSLISTAVFERKTESVYKMMVNAEAMVRQKCDGKDPEVYKFIVRLYDCIANANTQLQKVGILTNFNEEICGKIMSFEGEIANLKTKCEETESDTNKLQKQLSDAGSKSGKLEEQLRKVEADLKEAEFGLLRRNVVALGLFTAVVTAMTGVLSFSAKIFENIGNIAWQNVLSGTVLVVVILFGIMDSLFAFVNHVCDPEKGYKPRLKDWAIGIVVVAAVILLFFGLWDWFHHGASTSCVLKDSVQK